MVVGRIASGRKSPPVDPDKESLSVKPVVLVCLAMFIFVVWLRYSIFGFGYGPVVTAADYDKPVRLERLALPSEDIPTGYSLERKKIFSGPPGGDIRRAGIAKVFDRALVCVFSGRGKEVTVVVARRRGGVKLTREDACAREAFFLQDDKAFFCKGAPPASVNDLLSAFISHAKEEKRLRVKVAKLRTAGNASFCFFIDLLIGAFFFVLVLFLAKYFLIVRRLQN